MNNYSKSKSSLFLMELILTLLLFSICGAICMKLFAASHTLSKKTWELNKSVSVAQGFVEVMRGTSGDIEDLLSIYDKAISKGDSSFEVFYDSNFEECDYKDAFYIGNINIISENNIKDMNVRIERASDHEEIYSLSATKYTHNKDQNI